MKEKELIPVYIKIVRGNTVCICARDNKGCSQPCDMDVVERDRFRDWENLMNRDRYGKSRD